jgi:L-ascorbate metabolism protein UlaG (beta-lactamase superfamily)
LVSHQHSDHCSPDDIKKVSGPHTVVVASAPAAEKLPGARTVAPGDRLDAVGVTLEAVPAYNVNKFRAPGLHFHPKDERHVGYIVTVEGVRLYSPATPTPSPKCPASPATSHCCRSAERM